MKMRDRRRLVYTRTLRWLLIDWKPENARLYTQGWRPDVNGG